METLTKSQEQKIRNFIRSRVQTDEDCEDILQITLFESYLCSEKFKGESEYSTWLCGIGKNLCKNLHRKIKNFDFVEFNEALILENQEDVFDTVSKKIFFDAIKQCIKHLPKNYQRVFCMSAIEEKTYSEIANELDIPIGTVRSRINRSRQKIQKRLNQMGHHHLILS